MAKNKKTTFDEQIAKAIKDAQPKNVREVNTLFTTGSADKNVENKVKGPRQRQSLPVVKTSDGDVKINATDKQISEFIKNEENKVGAQKKRSAINEVKRKSIREERLVREMFGGVSNAKNTSKPPMPNAFEMASRMYLQNKNSSPYNGKSYTELTNLRKGIDARLHSGKITQKEAEKEKSTIDLWRVRTASKEELAQMRKEAEEYSKHYSTEYTKAWNVTGDYARGNVAKEKAAADGENRKKYLKSKADSYKNLISAIDAQLKEYEVDETYDNDLVRFGRIAIESGASDEYVQTNSGDDYDYNAINSYFRKESPDSGQLQLVGRKNYLYLQEGEIKLYNTLYNHDKEVAKEYLKSLEGVLSRRATNKSAEQAQKFGEEHPVLGGLASVGTNVVMGVPAAIDNAVEGVFGDVDTYDATSRTMRSSQAMRQSGSEYITKKHGKWAGFAYDTGLSIVENAANALLFKGVGGAAGVGAKAMSSAAAANMMGMAASNAMISAADRGGSDSQIILSGIANGAAEYVFEKISLDRLFSIKGTSGWKNVLKQIGVQSMVEGSEEGLTEIANILSDAMIMQGQSDNEIKRREYVLQGMSAEDATKKVFQESITQIVLSAAAGAISGGVMGGGATAIANVSHRSHMTDAGAKLLSNPDAFNRMIQIGIDNNNTEAVRAATQVMTDGVTLDKAQTGKMIESVISDVLAKKGDIADIVNVIATLEGRSPDYIGSRESIDTARAVMHFVNESATEADTRLLERSQGAITLLTAIEGDTKAWNSVKKAAKADAEYRASKGFDTPQVQNAEGKMQNDGEGNIVGVRYKISEKNENNISAVTTDEVTEIVKDTNSARKKLIEYAKKIFPKSVVNTDTGNEIGISRNGIDKFLSGNITKEKYATGYKIPELVKSAKKVGEATNKKNTEGIIGYDYYENVIQIDGENYTAHIRVRKTGMGDKYYGHTISQIIDQIKIEPLARSSEENSTVHPVNALGSTDSISETDATVNTQSMQENENYSAAEQLDIPEGSEIVNNIVVDEYSKGLKAQNPRAYSNIIRMARRLRMNVRFVKGLTNSQGKVLDGLITSKGIFINVDAKNPSRFVATHEFCHRMKQAAPEEWAKYQEFVINKLKRETFDGKRSKYDIAFEEKSKAYGKDKDADYINEEIASDYVRTLFKNEEELEAFLKKDKWLALKVRDMWYKILEGLGLLSDKKKAQQLWLKAYTAAAKNVADGKVGEYSEEKAKIITMSDRSGRKYVHATQRVIKSKNPDMWESEIIDYVNKTVRKGEDVVIPFDNDESITITGRTAWKLGDKGKMPNKFYLVKGNAAGVIDEVVEVSKSIDSRPPYKEHSEDFAKYGFDYRRAYFMDLDGKYYELTLSVGINKEGKEAYNIGHIKRMTFPVTGSKARGSRPYGKSSSKDNVPQNVPTVKNNSMQNAKKNAQEGKESIAGTSLFEIEERMKAQSAAENLKRENEQLREQLENLHIQLSQVEGKGLDTKAIKKAAQDIRRAYGSKIGVATLHQELTKLYTYMSGKNVDGKEVANRISVIANKVIENATETIDTGEYGDLLDTIRNTRIAVPEEDKASFADGYEYFRKKNMGKLNLVKDGYPLDALWDDLVEEYPHFFADDIIGSEERLNRILEVRDYLRPVEENIYGTDEAFRQAQTALENDIMESFYNIPEGGEGKYVFYDKRAAVAEKALKKREEQFNEAISRLDREYKYKVEKAEEQRDRYRDRFSKDKLRKNIDRDFRYLYSMFHNPTDNRHIPQELRESVGDLLRCFNFETKRLDGLRNAGKEAESPTAVRLKKMTEEFEKLLKEAHGAGSAVIMDEHLKEELEELRMSIPVNDNGEPKRLENMNLEELQAMYKVLKGAHHAVTEGNKAFADERHRTISEISDDFITEEEYTRASRKGNGEKVDNNKGIGKVLHTLDKALNVDNIKPWEMFHKIGGTMEALYKNARRGYDKHIENMKMASEVIQEAIKGVNVKKIQNRQRWFKLSSGENIQMTKAQIMSLYALYQRKQAREHILFGGIVVGVAKDVDGNKEHSRNAHKVKEEDLGKIFEVLSDKEKEAVEKIVMFMTKTCAAWGNETSMKLYGYEKFGESWYFPIKVSKESLQRYEGSYGEGNSRTQSATKKTVEHARNAIEIGDFFEVAIGHINGMSVYNALSLPLLDIERVLNYQQKIDGETTQTVRQVINKTHGINVEQYIEGFISDVDSTRKTDNGGGFLDWLLTKNKQAAIGLNLRVLFQQPTSITRAMMFLNPVDLAVHTPIGVSKLKKEMLEKMPIAWWKHSGFRDIRSGGSVTNALMGKESLYSKFAMGAYGWADDNTLARIYGAVKNEVKRKNPNLETDSAEYFERVKERFNEVIDRSQVVDSPFHKSQAMRKYKGIAGEAQAFMSEPITNLNMYRSVIEDAIKNGDAAKKLPRATAVFIVSNLLLAAAQSIPDTWREDDEEEIYYGEEHEKAGSRIPLGIRALRKLEENFIDDMQLWGQIPYIKDIVSMIKGFTSASERMEYAAISDLVTAAKSLTNDKKTIRARYIGIAKSGAAVFGVSLANVMRDGKGIIRTIYREMGDEYADYAVMKWDWDVTNPENKEKFMKHYKRALQNGHSEEAQLILEDYLASNFKGREFKNENAAAVTAEMADVYAATKDNRALYSLPENEFKYDGQEIVLSEKDYGEYAERRNSTLWEIAYDFVTSKGYDKLTDEEKAKGFGEIKDYSEKVVLQDYINNYAIPDWQMKLEEGEISYIDRAEENHANNILKELAMKMYRDSQKGGYTEENYVSGIKEIADKGYDTDDVRTAIKNAGRSTPEYKKKESDYLRSFVYDASALTSDEKGGVEQGRAAAAGYYADKELLPYEEGIRYMRMYDSELSDKMELDDFLIHRAKAKTTAAMADEKPNMKKDELETYLDSTNHSIAMKAALFRAIGDKGWKNKYDGTKNP